MPETQQQSALSEALDRLWIRFLPEIKERLSALEVAGALVATGDLSQAQRGQASAAAHKLAGVLGTFGLSRGTELAREAEEAYGGDLNPDRVHADRLEAIARELKSIVTNRK